jgi:hypothetical protein
LDNNPIDSNGFIYDFDAPGLPVNVELAGTIRRFRANFRAFAWVDIGGLSVRASGIYAYFVRFSTKQLGPDTTDNWSVIDPPDVVSDKQAGGPNGVTNLTENLL